MLPNHVCVWYILYGTCHRLRNYHHGKDTILQCAAFVYITTHLRFFLSRAHIHTTTAPSMIIETNITPPIPPAMAPISPKPPPLFKAPEVPEVGLSQSAWAVNESTSVGQVASTAILLLWTSMDGPLLTQLSMYGSTWAQSGRPDSSARYKTTCGFVVHRKCPVLMWFAVIEHWHLAFTAVIMELVISANFSSVFWNCKGYNENSSSRQ